MKATRHEIRIEKLPLSGKEIAVIDGKLTEDEINETYDNIESLGFRRNGKDFQNEYIPGGDNYAKFALELDVSKKKALRNFRLLKVSNLLVKEMNGSDNLTLGRISINLNTYGDATFPHPDCNPGVKDITVLYYCNKNWRYEWGGETIFYENKDARLAILPKPGRFIIFSGETIHKAGVPTRQCPIARITIAFKYKVKQNDHIEVIRA